MNDLEKNVDAQVEETVEEMKLKIDEITAASSGVEDDEKARKIDEIKDKAIKTLNKAIDNLASLSANIKNNEQLAKTIDYVKAKAK